jgi:hypothetical protein
METIKQVLMRRDGLSEAGADELIAEAREDFNERVTNRDSSAENICEEYFGLEPDYLEEFIV